MVEPDGLPAPPVEHGSEARSDAAIPALFPAQGRQSDGAARQSEALFTAVFRASPNMISPTTMAGGRYVDVNERFLRIWGRQRSGGVGRTSKEICVWGGGSLRSP